MKKILVVQQYYYPDISAVSQLLGDLLVELGKDPDYKITVLTGTYVRTDHDNIFEKIHKKDNYRNIDIVRIKTTLPNGKVFLHRFFEYISFFCGTFLYIFRKKKKFDLIISMTTPPLIGYFVSIALGKSKIPFLYYIEDLYPELLFDMGYINKYWVIRKLRVFNERILSRAERIITIGCYMNKKLYTNYGKNESNISIIPNWTKDSVFEEPKINGKFNILYSGNLGLAHDFSLIPDFVKAIEKKNLDISFTFIGAGRQFLAVKEMFRDCNIEYSFSGYKERSEHYQILNSANMFLISQKSETVGDILPSKFYSYISSGRPLLFLGTEKSEIGEFITNNDAGCILEIKEDITIAVDYIEKIIKDKAFYLRVCDTINKYYNTQLGFKRSFEVFRKVIDEITV